MACHTCCMYVNHQSLLRNMISLRGSRHRKGSTFSPKVSANARAEQDSAQELGGSPTAKFGGGICNSKRHSCSDDKREKQLARW